MHGSRSFYKILQLDPAADPAVIAAAYRALAKRHHPDVGGDARMAQALNEAYATLRDPDRRREYDRLLSTTVPVAPAASSLDAREALRPLVAALAPAFERIEPGAPAEHFDFVGRLRARPRHRLWLRGIRRGDEAEASAFRLLVRAARLCRAPWSPGSDLFVAVLPGPRRVFQALVRPPRGPFPLISHAIVTVDVDRARLSFARSSPQLPTIEPLASSLRIPHRRAA